MKPSVIVWDLETVPDLGGFAAANDLVGKSDMEIREAIGDKFPKHIYRANGVHLPVIRLPMCDEGADADNRVVDVLREFVADRLADFYVGLADEIVGGCEPGEVGHSLEVPDDDTWFHWIEYDIRPRLLGWALRRNFVLVGCAVGF